MAISFSIQKYSPNLFQFVATTILNGDKSSKHSQNLSYRNFFCSKYSLISKLLPIFAADNLKANYMRKFLMLLILSFFASLTYSQKVIYMDREGGIYKIQCTVNGARMKMIFDTGASNVCRLENGQSEIKCFGLALQRTQNISNRGNGDWLHCALGPMPQWD